jgi:superoxide reductase
MELMTERTAANEGVEKHVPVVAEEGTGVLAVKVGSVEHPMSEEHYIEWIEVQEDNGNVQARFLNPQDKPFARFELTGKPVKVRAYCNLHGLWKA